MTTKSIGILGGTFDPVHFGHLRTALDVREQLNLDHIRLIPNQTPPHRTAPKADGQQRSLMLQIATKNSPELLVDNRELEREGPSYMVDTLRSLREDFPDTPLFLLLGTDAFLAIQSWHQWDRLLDLAHLAVMRRPDDKPLEMDEALSEWYQQYKAVAADASLSAGKIWDVPVTQLMISSTRIREKLESGQSVNYLLPDSLIQLIEQLGLYQN